MSNYSVCTWNTLDLFAGDPVAFVDFHESIGARAICIKIGNKRNPWVGLEPYIAEAKRRGLLIAGWWFYYGYNGEAEISANHAEELGFDTLALDIESQWESRVALTAQGRRQRAAKMMKVIKRRFTGNVALCSWWKPSVHKTPVDVFLNEGCDWNMPQLYWIGRRSIAHVRELIETSLEEYGRLANWTPAKTKPVLASFGQSYKIRSKKYWWKATVEQMQAAFLRAMSLGCPSVNWWSLDYLRGRAGHEAPRRIEHEMIAKIRSFGDVDYPVSSQVEQLNKIIEQLLELKREMEA